MKTFAAILLCLSFLLVSCKTGVNAPIGEEEFQYGVPPGGVPKHPEHGMEVWFAYGAMEGIEEEPASGVAQAHRFEDGSYLHTVQLNIAIPPDGYFYEGWLEKIDGSGRRTTGHLSNARGDTRHGLRFETDDEMRGHLRVLVTLEKDDGNPAPGEFVAEGTMKITVRP